MLIVNEAYVHCTLIDVYFFSGQVEVKTVVLLSSGFTLLHCCVNLRLFLIAFNLETLVHLLNFNEIDTIDLCMKLFFFCYLHDATA